MNDIDIAKATLEKNDLSLAIVKEGKVLYSSSAKGIKPLYTALEEIGGELSGASIADKVIGKAAALLCNSVGIKAIYTKLISEQAIKILKKTNIEFYYNQVVPYIKNRDKTDMCPIEKMAETTDDHEEMISKLEDFFEKMKKGQVKWKLLS